MEENYENKSEQSEHNSHHHHDCDTPTCWLKYLVISLAAFFGAFLAVYFVADQSVHKYMMPPRHPVPPMHKMLTDREVQKMLKDQERMFDDIAMFETTMNPFLVNPVKIETYKNKDAYVITIDLKPFGGDADKIKVDVKPTKVRLSGESDETNKGTTKDISFMQNFSLPQKIDVEDVTKEVKGDKYVITLPIED